MQLKFKLNSIKKINNQKHASYYIHIKSTIISLTVYNAFKSTFIVSSKIIHSIYKTFNVYIILTV